MSAEFASAGDYSLVLQQYQYQQHLIICAIKISPRTIHFYEKSSQKVYNWLTPTHWTQIENELWRLCDKTTDWHKNARKLKAELLIDNNIKLNVRSTIDLIVPAHKLLQSETLPGKSVPLELLVEYVSEADAPPTKRKKAADTEIQKIKDIPRKITKKHSVSEKFSQPKDRVEAPATSRIKHERRSISQDSHRLTPDAISVRRSRPIKREDNSHTRLTTSVESSIRRSDRSVVQPCRFNEFVMGDKDARKFKSSLSPNSDGIKASTKKRQNSKLTTLATGKTMANTNGATTSKPSLSHQLDGAAMHIDVEALKRLNSLLDIPKPREVQILLLADMTAEDVLNTFDKYRTDFDKFFKQRKHMSATDSCMTVSHIDVMDILSKETRKQMIQKLSELYSKSGPHASLVINGLLPLWIIRLFMDKYSFTPDQAVQQIKDQLDYNSYLKALNDEPLSSDLED